MTLAVRFFDMGEGVFPLTSRSKEPARGCLWTNYRCTREIAALFRDYGVRLVQLGVADTDTGEAEAWAAAHLPETPLMVGTARGIHRYYRIVGKQPSFIHRDGQKLEFRNRGQYVVGPGSVHSNGHIYTTSDWSWQLTDLPMLPRAFVFDDRGQRDAGVAPLVGAPYEFPDVVKEPGRHDELFRLLRQCKGRGWDKESTREVVGMANQHRCQPPLREDRTFEE